MGKIQRVIDIVTASNADIESALLQCKVLARRLQYRPLEAWIDWELTGYDKFDDLPDYRKFKSDPRGLYTNGAWSVKNQSVNPLVVGDELYERISSLPVYQGIGRLIAQNQTEDLSVPLTIYEGEVNRLYGLSVEGGYGFIGLHLPIPSGVFDSVISAVKSKILSFLLDMEDIFPEEEDIKDLSVEQKREVAQAFTQNIYNIGIGAVRNIAVGPDARLEDHSVTVEMNISEGSVEDLTNYLVSQGLEPEDIEEIDPILVYVYEGSLNNSQKSMLKRWIEDKGAKMARRIGKETAVSMIVQALIQYAPAAADLLSGAIN